LDVARHLDVRAEPPQHGARPWTLAVLYRVEGEVQRYGIVVDIAKVWHAAGCVCLAVLVIPAVQEPVHR